MILNDARPQVLCNFHIVYADAVNKPKVVAFPAFVVSHHLAQGTIYIKV